ncbi:MAG: T9SS type A sorting domain-containing protein [Bacteroidetes bacterium]|nr:T9SS type A sorting domain-containing protein [Bacteroidota bacterium]
MKKTFLLLILVSTQIAFSQPSNSPYPIIFVHGLNSSDLTWDNTITQLSQTWQSSNNHKLHFVLNAKSNVTDYLQDVIIPLIDQDGTIVNKITKSSLYSINFNNFWNQNPSDPRIYLYNSGTPGVNESTSNQSAIFKQGYALKICIDSVLRVTGAEKVILVGHSMGGLAIREYLQRKENGNYKWWQNPNEEDGHKVAKVVTIGTPHLGSNASTFNPTFNIDNNSEAVRDLRYSYLSGFDAPYLFSNLESNIPSNFYNNDVNCNGNNVDFIDGLSYGTNYSLVMPLPQNVLYTWIVSKFEIGPFSFDWDGVVDANRQWLNVSGTPSPVGIADTILTNKNHLRETEDSQSIIRGLDEPDSVNFAYPIKFNTSYSGFITTQPFGSLLDIDFYKVTVPQNGNLNVTISGTNAGLTGIALLANNSVLVSKNILNTTEIINFQVNPGDYFIRVRGQGDENLNFNSYRLNTIFTPQILNNGLLAYYPLDNDASDYSGNGYNGTLENSPSFENGVIGNGVKIYGTDFVYGNGKCVILPASLATNLNSCSNFTISLWVKEEGMAHYHGDSYIFFGNHSLGYAGISHLYNPDNNSQEINFCVGSDEYNIFPFRVPFPGNYSPHFILYTMTYSNGVLKAYIDGNFIGEKNQSVLIGEPRAAIGRHYWNREQLYWSTRLQGVIDDVRIYNRTLSDNEIRLLYSPDKSLSLNAPNGNENFEAGSVQNITWNGYGVSNLKIELSTNNGYNWTSLSDNYSASLGNFQWTVPYINSITCKIRISDASNQEVNSTSSSVFTIYTSNINAGLLAYFPFNGNANDASGNNNNGTVYGCSSVPDRFENPNSAYSFNGINNYIVVPYNSNLYSPELSVSTWIQFNVLDGTREQILTVNNNGWAGYAFDIESTTNALEWEDYTGSWYNGVINYPLSNFTQNTWYHFVIVRSLNSLKLYVNGSLVSSQNNLTPYNLPASSILVIGSHSIDFLLAPFNGKIDDIRFYNRVLSQNEIFTLNNEVLPVQLTSFLSLIDKNNIELKWATSSEQNNSGFDIERKLTSENNWNKVGFVQGSGNSNEKKDFSFTDRNLSSGKYNYRLKQIDYNGNFKYYSLQNEVEIGIPIKFELSQNYPNPFNPNTKIYYSLPIDSKVTLIVYDILGREIMILINKEVKLSGYYFVDFSGLNLSSGIYFYRLETEKFESVKKMILLK